MFHQQRVFSFSEKKANGIQNECYDVMLKEVSYENLAICAEDGDFVIFFKTADMGIVREFLSRYALGQLCSKLGVPVRYIEKCIKADQNVLANKNLNTGSCGCSHRSCTGLYP